MWHINAEENVDRNTDELYLAGEKVLPGIYRQVGSVREIRLETEDVLPGSLDGRVACYIRIYNTWAQLSHHNIAHA